MATSGRHMARFSARDCAIGPVRTVPIHPSSQIRGLLNRQIAAVSAGKL